jgi:hypothetical protein
MFAATASIPLPGGQSEIASGDIDGDGPRARRPESSGGDAIHSRRRQLGRSLCAELPPVVAGTWSVLVAPLRTKKQHIWLPQSGR